MLQDISVPLTNGGQEETFSGGRLSRNCPLGMSFLWNSCYWPLLEAKHSLCTGINDHTSCWAWTIMPWIFRHTYLGFIWSQTGKPQNPVYYTQECLWRDLHINRAVKYLKAMKGLDLLLYVPRRWPSDVVSQHLWSGVIRVHVCFLLRWFLVSGPH